MIVLGIDPGTATTGYGLVNETPTGGLEAIAYGAIRTPPNLEMHRRLLLIYQQLKEILLLHHPSCGAVEKLYFQTNVTTALAVGQARGVILLALAEADLAVAEYSPLEVKQAISGYGGADKHQVQEMTRVLLNLEKIPRPDDAADALAIAICHLSHNRFNSLVAETKDP